MDVQLTIESINEGGRVVQQANARLYERDGRTYYYYEEPRSEMGRIVSILRVEPDYIRLLRQGDIESEQQFRVGTRLPGYYDTIHGRLELDTETTELDNRLENGIGTLSWSYELYVSGERTGFHQLLIKAVAL
ncbi:MAG: hypothetical protein K0R57_4937 [Paenibacillaceae bacterium]|nr:hypothetical protein [Paenibacillaceae bacterium]